MAASHLSKYRLWPPSIIFKFRRVEFLIGPSRILFLQVSLT